MSELKKRAPNFSGKEKEALVNIIYNYREIIECKKTDGTTWREKDEAWEKVASSFNAQLPDNYPRSKDSLRKLYENMKKNVRKDAANDKKELTKTGGGIPEKNEKDSYNSLVLDLINRKTVYGFQNPFDSDATDNSCSKITENEASNNELLPEPSTSISEMNHIGSDPAPLVTTRNVNSNKQVNFASVL